MHEEKTQPTIEPPKVEEQEQPGAPAEPEEEDSASMPQENQQDAEETIEKQEAPATETDQQVGWALAHQNDQDGAQEEGQAPFDGTTPPKGASPKGLVRGIVYSADSGSALVDDTIVRAGCTIDGVKVVRVHAGGVDFEKDGRRWTQKVSETPNPLWQ
jgi:hypothetical protein